MQKTLKQLLPEWLVLVLIGKAIGTFIFLP